MNQVTILLVMNFVSITTHHYPIYDKGDDDNDDYGADDYFPSIFVWISPDANITGKIPSKLSHASAIRAKLTEKGDESIASKKIISNNAKGEGERSDLRIIGGHPAEYGDVPWQVAIKKPFRTRRHTLLYRVFCGGSIIRSDKILTAAHCFEDCISHRPMCNKGVMVEDKLRIYYGVAGTLKTTSRKFQDGEWRGFATGFHLPRYKFPHNDIAILVTNRPFTFDSKIHPIKLETDYKDYHGRAIASGYGGMNSAFEKKMNQSPRLLVAYLTLLPQSKCTGSDVIKLGKKFICTESGSIDTSRGDSGGPLATLEEGQPLTEARLIGITTGIMRIDKKSGGHHHLTYFTRVSSYKKFIKENVATKMYSSKIALIVKFLCIKYFCC